MTLRKILAGVGLTGLCLLSGCGSEGNAWSRIVESTQSWYGTYINPPASIDYEAVGDVDAASRVLARRMKGIDDQLTLLERALDGADHPPTPELVSSLKEHFPWLSGLAAVDTNGEILAREPEIALKPLDFSLPVKDLATGTRALRGMVQDTPLGPEVLLGSPIYKDTEWLGLFFVHFDLRSLLKWADEPTDLVVLSLAGPLWPGRFVYAETPLAGVDWGKTLKGDICGVLSNTHGKFLWMVRYLGGAPLVFAVPVEGTFPEDPAQLKALPR